MRIEDLIYFIRVAEAGSISQVAQNHFITQQGLSRIISSLESELDVKLLHRGKTLKLTPAGKALLSDCKAIEESYLRILDVAAGMSSRWNNAKGNIYTIYATPVICATLLPRIITTLNRKFPGMFFNVLEQLPLDITDKIGSQPLHNPCSIAILSIPDFLEAESKTLADETITFEPLFCDELCIGVSSDSPLTSQSVISTDQLRDMRIVLHNSENLMGKRLLGVHYEGASVTHITNHPLCRDMVEQGSAVGLTSALIQYAYQDNVVAVPLDKKITIHYGCVHWPNEDPFVAEIASVIRDCFRQISRSGTP